MQYASKKSFFSDKEIIFRSNGRAKVFTISSKMQVIFLFLVAFVGIWSFYYYHMYRRSDLIIVRKNNELIATRDAYVDLMGDFVTLQGNIADMIKTLDNAKTSELNLGQYQQQASVVEEKVKQITTQVNWINTEKLAEKANLNEISLQRDIAISERDELRRQLVELQETVEDIKKAETEILDRVAAIAEKEIGKIKSAVAALPQVRAIGETGLDRLRGADADMQEMIFRRHIELGEKLGKPIILHVVKSSDRLSAIRKELAPRLTTPWIWHGFRGKPQAALQFLSTATPQSPVYISLGEKFNYETAGIIPDSNLLAETDDAPTGITNVIRKLAEVRHTPEQHLTECISNNCTAILGGHTI